MKQNIHKTIPLIKSMFAFICWIIAAKCGAQNLGIGDSSFIPNSSAILEMRTIDKGLLVPRLTSSQRNSISNPAKGLLIYQINDSDGFYYYNGNFWTDLKAMDNLGDHTATQNLSLGSYSLSGDGDPEGVFVDPIGNVGIGSVPTRKLDVLTNSYEYGFRHTDGVVDLSSYIDPSRAWIGTASNHPLSFYVDDSYPPQMTIDTSKNVGIGIKHPLSLLHLVKDQHATTELRVDNLYSGSDLDHTVIALNHGNTRMGFMSHNNTTKVLSLGHAHEEGKIDIFSGGKPVIHIDTSGNFGIGTAPSYPLHVANYSTSNGLTAQFYAANGTSGNATSNRNLSAYFSHQIACQELQVFSDRRIKNILGTSDGNEDLATLMKIKITNYTFIDSITNNRAEKKVIAQQVEEVYPQAVSQGKGFIPSIYALGSVEPASEHNMVRISMDMPHNLKSGDRVRIILNDGNVAEPVVSCILDTRSFTIPALQTNQEHLFVFGKEISDFRSVDYEALSMLNISATQQLHRIILQQQSEINRLTKKNQNVSQEVNLLRQEIEKLKFCINPPVKKQGLVLAY